MTVRTAGLVILAAGVLLLTARGQEGDSTAALRKRGWGILESFTHQSSGLPDKNRWFINDESAPPQAAAANLVLAGVTNKVAFAAALAVGAPAAAQYQEPVLPAAMLRETVLFNESALRYVQKQHGASDRLLKNDMVRELNFPPGSAAVKMFWYPMKKNQRIQVQLWDWRKVPEGTARLPGGKMATACFATGDQIASDCPAPNDAFYTIKPGEWPCNPCSSTAEFEVFLLMGMHVATKTSPDWSWFTYWWRGGVEGNPRTKGESWTCDNAQRDEILPGLAAPWSNYSMNATDSFMGALSKPTEADRLACGVPKKIDRLVDNNWVYKEDEYRAVYNPFVEGVPEDGRRTNCLRCHAGANTSTTAGKFPNPADPREGPRLMDFEGHIRTDYMWSIVDYVGRTTPK